MLILGKLWILYFPRPLKCCTYELLSIRENRIEKTQDTGLRTTTMVALFWIANFVNKKNLSHSGISLVYFLFIALVYQYHNLDYWIWILFKPMLPFTAQKFSQIIPFRGPAELAHFFCVCFIRRFIYGQLLIPYFDPWSWQISIEQKCR